MGTLGDGSRVRGTRGASGDTWGRGEVSQRARRLCLAGAGTCPAQILLNEPSASGMKQWLSSQCRGHWGRGWESESETTWGSGSLGVRALESSSGEVLVCRGLKGGAGDGQAGLGAGGPGGGWPASPWGPLGGAEAPFCTPHLQYLEQLPLPLPVPAPTLRLCSCFVCCRRLGVLRAGSSFPAPFRTPLNPTPPASSPLWAVALGCGQAGEPGPRFRWGLSSGRRQEGTRRVGNYIWEQHPPQLPWGCY